MTRPRTCSDCATPITKYSKKGRCRACAYKALTKPRGACRVCGSTLETRNTTGLCRTHYNQSPGKRMQNSRTHKRIAATPEARERFVRQGYINYHKGIGRPEVLAMTQTPECRKRMGEAQSRTKLQRAGIPPDMRERYLYLLRKKGLRAAEARAVIHAEIAAKEAAMTPFERQMRALEQGARLVEVPRNTQLFGAMRRCG